MAKAFLFLSARRSYTHTRVYIYTERERLHKDIVDLGHICSWGRGVAVTFTVLYLLLSWLCLSLSCSLLSSSGTLFCRFSPFISNSFTAPSSQSYTHALFSRARSPAAIITCGSVFLWATLFSWKSSSFRFSPCFTSSSRRSSQIWASLWYCSSSLAEAAV